MGSSTRDLKRVLNLETLRKELRARGVQEDALPKGLPPIRFHDLRHAVGTHLGKLGVPVKVIQEYLGHSTPTITLSFYSHVLPGMKEEAAVRLAARLLGTHRQRGAGTTKLTGCARVGGAWNSGFWMEESCSLPDHP